MLEKLIRSLMEECSSKQRGDFSLSEFVSGYWNKSERTDIEIDIVAVSDDRKRVRFGSCKRQAAAHDGDACAIFEGHIRRFLETKAGGRLAACRVEKALYAPVFDQRTRQDRQAAGYICHDLSDFDKWLTGRCRPYPPVTLIWRLTAGALVVRSITKSWPFGLRPMASSIARDNSSLPSEARIGVRRSAASSCRGT